MALHAKYGCVYDTGGLDLPDERTKEDSGAGVAYWRGRKKSRLRRGAAFCVYHYIIAWVWRFCVQDGRGVHTDVLVFIIKLTPKVRNSVVFLESMLCAL